MNRFQLVSCNITWKTCRKIGLWQVVYGVDIFFNNVPLLKTFLLLFGLIIWGLNGKTK